MKLGAIAALACATGLAAAATALGASGPPPRCTPNALRLHVSMEGENTGALVYLVMVNRGDAPCRVVGTVTFELTRFGVRARIRSNPLATLAAATLAPHVPQVEDGPRFWWGNWCGPRRSFAVVAQYDGITSVSGFDGPVPVCVRAAKPSVLELVR
jgi:hypothetical protein